jgi:polyisoprenoid-binding protein YceI
MAPWQLDPVHSAIQFSARHMMVSNVRGSFRDFSLEVVFDPEHPELGSVVATVVAASIDTGQAQRDAHLRSPDFLDAEQFPTLTFRSTGVEARSGDTFALKGELTMHGVTLPVVFDAEYVGEVANPQGGRSAGLSARGRIKRHDWGLAWNVGLEAGGLMVSDEIKVEVEVELTQAAPVDVGRPLVASSGAA